MFLFCFVERTRKEDDEPFSSHVVHCDQVRSDYLKNEKEVTMVKKNLK